MSKVLYLAAAYNLIWGALVILFPEITIQILGIQSLNHIEIWQSLGMVVGVYGVGYFVAARDPLTHWPIILVGFLGKVLGPLGFLFSAINGNLPWKFGRLNIVNDLIWLPFFFLILITARKRATTSL